MRDQDLEKLKHLLIKYFTKIFFSEDLISSEQMLNIIENRKFEKVSAPSVIFPSGFKINILCDPDAFTENVNFVELIEGIFLSKIKKFIRDSQLIEVKLIPDFDKIEVLNSEIEIVQTDWDEINIIQKKLIETFKESKDSYDYQAIGNLSRSLIKKLSDAVFIETKHNPDPEDENLNKGKSKNRLKKYIEIECAGRSNKEFRSFAKSAIEFLSNSVDLMNATTHKINADKNFAEFCLIGAISTVRIVQVISSDK